MSTRLYFSNALAPVDVHSSLRGEGGDSDHWPYLLDTIKDDPALSSITRNVQTTSGGKWNLFSALSAPLESGQTIDGPIKAIIRVKEQSTGQDLCALFRAMLVSEDGQSYSGLLIDYDESALSNEFSTTLQNRKYPRGWTGDGVTPTSCVSDDGDRIYINIQLIAYGSSTGQASCSIGSPSGVADCAENETGSLPYVPWIEFADDLVFKDPAARVSQAPLEVLVDSPGAKARVSQASAETIVRPTDGMARSSQVVLEVVYPSSDMTSWYEYQDDGQFTWFT